MFPGDRFDCYVQAALICPEGSLDDVAAFVDDRKSAWIFAPASRPSESPSRPG